MRSLIHWNSRNVHLNICILFYANYVVHSYPTLCYPMDCSMPGFPVLHYLPRVCSNPYPLSLLCHPTISSSVIPFSCLQSFPASGSFPVSQLFTSDSQNISALASASVLPKNIQGWFPLGLTGLISKLGNGTPPQYSCLENPMDGGAWWAAIHGVAKSRTRLSDFTFTFHFHALEKEMAAHSSILAWRIPGMGEPGGLLSMGSHRVGHDWSDLAAVAAA